MNPESMQSMNVQAQIRRNAEEQSNFLQSLGQWEKDVKVKDADMKRARKVKVREANKKNGGPSAKPRESGGTVTIRQATKEDFEVSGEVQATVDSKKRKDDEKGVFLGTGVGAHSEITPASIVNTPHLVNTGKAVPKPAPRRSTDDLETEERNRGNDFFKKGDYEGAVKSYTRCLGINSRSGVAFSNRAMAYLKLREFGRAEKDASSALEIDPAHIKSYQRRSSARVSLGKLRAALRDLKTAENIDGGGKGLAVEIRKCTEALRDAVKRAPKRRIRVVGVVGVGARNPNEEEEEEVVLELGEDGFDVADAPPPVPGKAKKLKAPKTAYDFEKTWRSLKGAAGEKKRYLMESVSEGLLCKIFSKGFQDGEIFEGILSVLDGVRGEAEIEKVKLRVDDLSRVKNVDMLCMMADKALVSRLVKRCFGEAVPAGVKMALLS